MTLVLRRALIVCALVAALGITGCVPGFQTQPQHHGPAQATPQYRPITRDGKYAGIATLDLRGFIRACGCRPNLGVRYVPWPMPPDMTVPRFMLANGILPLIELMPLRVSLITIVRGHADSWLISWARAIRSLRAPVLVSFAPEANGRRYSYGYHHAPARLFVAAWRHVVRLFAHVGASQVRWVWMMIASNSASAPLTPLWPGDAWVNAVGLDGYLFHRRSTVEATFGLTFADIRRFTRKPLLITETAATPAAGKARVVQELTAFVNRDHLAGFIWFDKNFSRVRQAKISWRIDWRLETDPAALAAFRRVVQSYRHG